MNTYNDFRKAGWTIVPLYRYFEKTAANTLEAQWIKDWKIRPWCQDRFLDGDWEIHGVTRYSYRLYFKNSDDALLFTLSFKV